MQFYFLKETCNESLSYKGDNQLFKTITHTTQKCLETKILDIIICIYSNSRSILCEIHRSHKIVLQQKSKNVTSAKTKLLQPYPKAYLRFESCQYIQINIAIKYL